MSSTKKMSSNILPFDCQCNKCKDCVYKHNCNKNYVDNLPIYDDRYFVVILDSTNRRTARYLKKKGYTKNQIIIIENMKIKYDKHKKSGYTVFNSFEDFSNFDFYGRIFAGAFFDFTGGIPKQGKQIPLFFDILSKNKVKIRNGSTLSITFSKRTGKPKGKHPRKRRFTKKPKKEPRFQKDFDLLTNQIKSKLLYHDMKQNGSPILKKGIIYYNFILNNIINV